MTFTSAPQPNPKAAEFARLFQLFDRIATRRTRGVTGDIRQLISADDIASVPSEFAPVLQNLSTIVSMRALRDEERGRRSQPTSIGRPRRITVSGVPPPSLAAGRIPLLSPSEETIEEPDSPTFPLEERYPFTFKLMLHKLYDLDEWVAKVKTAVENSKSQFKPLAERVQNVVVRETTVVKERMEKKKSSPRLPLSPSPKSKTHAHATIRHAYPHSPTSSTKPETSRAVKKRCIGRRKSLSGPISTGVWVYDAAISAVEITGPRPSVEITLSQSSDGFADRRDRHQSLAAMEGIHARDVARRKVKIAVNLVRENAQHCASERQTSISFAEEMKEATGGESPSKRRRATMAFTFDPEPFKRVAVKRPLCP